MTGIALHCGYEKLHYGYKMVYCRHRLYIWNANSRVRNDCSATRIDKGNVGQVGPQIRHPILKFYYIPFHNLWLICLVDSVKFMGHPKPQILNLSKYFAIYDSLLHISICKYTHKLAIYWILYSLTKSRNCLSSFIKNTLTCTLLCKKMDSQEHEFLYPGWRYGHNENITTC